MAGDFNVFWGDQELALFLAATHLRSANDQGSPSHPSRSPKRQLDFILYSPELTVKDFFIPDVILSDHTPWSAISVNNLGIQALYIERQLFSYSVNPDKRQRSIPEEIISSARLYLLYNFLC